MGWHRVAPKHWPKFSALGTGIDDKSVAPGPWLKRSKPMQRIRFLRRPLNPRLPTRVHRTALVRALRTALNGIRMSSSWHDKRIGSVDIINSCRPLTLQLNYSVTGVRSSCRLCSRHPAKSWLIRCGSRPAIASSTAYKMHCQTDHGSPCRAHQPWKITSNLSPWQNYFTALEHRKFWPPIKLLAFSSWKI